MSVYFDKTKQRWRYSYNRVIGGRRSRVTKLLERGWDQERAEAYDRQTSSSLYAQAKGLETERLSLDGATALYIKHRCPQLRNGRKAGQALNLLMEDIGKGTRYLDEVEAIAAEYQKAYAKKLAPATIHNRLAYLRAAVRYARKHHGYGRGQPDHTASMPMPFVNNGRDVYATVPQLKELWGKFTDPEARAMFRLAFYMGLRWRAELWRRKPEDIKRSGKDVWLEIGKTKNGQPLMKWVHPDAREDLKYIPFEQSDATMYVRWRDAVAKIGRPDLKPHDLRHSLASEILSRNTGTLDQVRAALHHKSLAAAHRYAHLYPSAQKAVLSAIGAGHESAHKSPKKKRGPQKRAA